MTEQNENQNQPESQTKTGRPPVLDENKRRQVVAILANGSSRRVAAHVVGCSHSTIARTAQRNPDFAAEIEAAEYGVEVRALRQINAAADKGRYWRTAAWLLERRNPRDFAPKTPDAITPEAVAAIILKMLDSIIRKLSDEEFDAFQDKLYETARALHETNDLSRYLSSPPPSKPDYVARDKDSSQNSPLPLGEGQGVRAAGSSARNLENDPKTEPFAPPLHREDGDPDFDLQTNPLTPQ